jgi:beta-carotene ketolase (CrtW type)
MEVGTLPKLGNRLNLKVAIFGHEGAFLGLAIALLWIACLVIGLNFPLNEIGFSGILPLLGLFLLQTHLYTGLFITAHDAMHRLVSKSQVLNNFVGRVVLLLFAFNSFNKLNKAHQEHHKHPGTDHDPDFHQTTEGGSAGFWPWYGNFLSQYVSWVQILGMAVSFNLLKLVVPVENLLVFWIAPSILSTFQLFYFGTYRPHKGVHQAGDPHRARSQNPNHALAIITCYFFGYHAEHHAMPYLPWYKLAAARNATHTMQRQSMASA